ncbi:ABC transporter permease [Acidobacteria bacterium AB60]|nr:ABC transporter permease [Acidobacteria bacterium AB60]
MRMGMGNDLGFAVRQFRRVPGYAGFTVLVLALGIGTVTAMFTICYAVLLKPLPFQAGGRLYQAVEKGPQAEDGVQVRNDELRDWQQAAQGRAEIAFHSGGLNIADGPGGAVLISEVDASGNLFDVLGARPLMGRGFSHEEAEQGANVAVLSYALWQQEFASDPQVVGKQLHVGGVPRTVIGVMPPQFLYPVWDDRPELWVPADRGAGATGVNGAFFAPVVRVNRGVPLSAVETALARVHARYGKDAKTTIRLVGVRELLVADVRPALLALSAAVCVVWLIACSNVAGLMLARVMARRRELAVRAALGAGRWRLALQLLVESVVLSCAGALAGLGLAAAILQVFRHLLTQKVPLAGDLHLNWAVWMGLVALTLLTGLAFGTAPALMAARTQVHEALKRGGKAQAGDHGQNRARTLLLVGQVALSVALLIGAGLMLRTMYALRHVPLGFRSDHLVLASVTIPNDLYKDRNVGTAVWQPLLEEVRRLPGVRAAALSTVLPIQHPVELITVVYATAWMHGDGNATVRAATPGLTDALGVRMRSGRFFTAEDTASSLPVVVVNQTFVDRYLGGGDARGKVIRYGRVPRAATVVGVMEDVHQDSVAGASQPEFYLSVAQLGPDQQIYRALLGRFLQVAVRTDAPPAGMIEELRRGIPRANPHLALGACMTMTEAVEDSIGAQKLVAQVIAGFGALVLLIAVVGVYGLLHYVVTQRTQEIGIRMALGADRARVLGMVLRHTLALLLAGTAGGIGIALLCGPLLEGFLFGVKAADPWTMGVMSLGLVVCGLLAAVGPARRAVGVNPVEALRAE